MPVLITSTKRRIGTIQRSKGIGGSDIGAICGLSKYKTAYQVYLEKRGELIEDNNDSTRLRFGRRLEKPVADEFAFVTGRKLWRAKTTQRHPTIPYFLANIDRWQHKEQDGKLLKGTYEGKTADWTQRPLWIQGGVPDSYYLQLQWYMLVTGCAFGSFGVLFGLSDFHFFDVERDEATISQLIALGQDFWRRVKDGNPPDYQFGEAGAALVKKLYAKAEPKKAIQFDGPEAEAKVRRLLQLKQAIKTREAEERDLTTWLQLQMGDAEIATYPDLAKITWANTSRSLIDLDRLREEHPKIAKDLTVETPGRRFSIKALDQAAIEEDRTPDAPLIITSGVRSIELD